MYYTAIQLQPNPRIRIGVLKSHLGRLVFPPGQGLLVCRTVGTTETPGVLPDSWVPLEDSIFIHLCCAPGLKIIIINRNIMDIINTCSALGKHP